MSRPVFSFRPNLENAAHRKAWGILQRVPEGQKNHFLVQAILKEGNEATLEAVIRRTVREELKGVKTEQIKSDGAGDIPDQMLDFLSQMDD
ncbi:hypothetical protein [Hespellia stercorisuis]|uniref:Plasmid segregation centromere-binding protein ParR n=1 Tax=Hespellia stercorisuis DSM 15480 TaxID=1121950 RepID=A0A1M6TBE0_9FIRM|nr:hypothetical protein [Hespellia stercorisuis]SHK54313.1 hypothetical protein SAMN02745243_03183 [Hespellia stercorisuis DSM 15480]